ncbi:MAG: membrane bound O-acyl transferase family-domain-containing protein, partial [Planctomycetaceae bacterium]|nr:membrane bound O-acyl transferase family-domain-containing protein [Planctomycetaceae bacterium]
GLVLVMHSGVLAILATLWRAAGMNVAPVMRAPVASKSLSDFWSTRWNIPFTEMLRATVLKPARRLFGRHGAVLACFLVSGVLHDVAISLPVQAGYGLPTLYFLLHGVLVLVERWLEQRGIALSSSWIGRVWCFAWIVGPLPLLMHEPFIKGVVMPVFGH